MVRPFMRYEIVGPGAGDVVIKGVYKIGGVECWSDRVSDTFNLPLLMVQQYHE